MHKVIQKKQEIGKIVPQKNDFTVIFNTETMEKIEKGQHVFQV